MTRSNLVILPLITLLIATTSWSPPNANVQPKGTPGLIQDGIRVESVQGPATVQSTALSSGHGET